MREPATFDAEFRPRFCLTVDTEESFDWDGPFSRVDHHCRAVPALAKGQAFFAAAHVVPTYFMDYPVATNAACRDALGAHQIDGAAMIPECTRFGGAVQFMSRAMDAGWSTLVF